MLEFFGHLTFALIAFSYLVRDILLLRILSIVASAAGIFYNFFVAAEPLWLVINWNLVFVGVNVAQIIASLYDKRKIAFSEEQQELYETVFQQFSPIEFLKIMRIAQKHQAEPNQLLATAGQQLDSLMLIVSGEALVENQDKELNRLKDGQFIGEMGFWFDQDATASVKVLNPTQYLSWKKSELKKLLERNPNLKFAMQTIIGRDLSKKLISQDPV